ncbi:MAG: nucleotidyltransferase domain-containing protein, partial [Alistipes sp.]|nr:nucleotidyltransferase domain-containing protein [Alistipes sp.]
AAYIAAQATITYYRVLYYVYHNEEFACDDIATLHERMRLLSTELMLLFDDTHVGHNTTLGSLQRAARMAMTARAFTMQASELHAHLERVARLGEIVEKCCRRRLGEYEVRCAK